MTSQNQSSNTAKTDPENEGLPEIAHKTKQNQLLAGIFLTLILIAVFLIHHCYSHKSKDDENTNENFSVNSSQKLNPPDQPQIQQKTQIPEPNKVPPETVQQIQKEQLQAQKAVIARLQAPMMIVKSNSESTRHTSSSDNVNNETSSNHLNPNTEFLNQAASQKVKTAQATILPHRSELIAQGSLIHATLETTIDSDLPGMLRAIVSQPVYSEDGSTVLIHRGSRLIGQYKSGIEKGQTRIFVVWTRVIEPNGIAVQLGSPGVDSLGVAGFGADNIDNHFWEMFGTASLLSVIGAGASNVGVNPMDQYNASQMYRQALSQSFAQSANNALQKNYSIPPTLHKNQGAAVIVFVAKDLDFTKAMRREGLGMDIF